MMKHRLIKWMGVIGCMLGLCACGMMADEDKNIDTAFQDNGPLNIDNPDAGFKILDIFDGRGSLEDVWDSIDAKETNPRLSCTVDHLTDEFVTFSNVAAGILRHESQPLALLLSENTAGLLALIRNETDPFFVESPPDIGAFYTQTPGDYADAFYAFLDALWEGDQRPGDQDMVAMARKVVQRMLDKKDALEILEDMQELIDDIGDDDFDRNFNDLSSLLGKLMIRADYPLWIDGTVPPETALPLNRDAINPAIDRNLGIGNAVAGVNTLVNWMNTMMADPTARSFFYDVIRETATVFDPDGLSPNADKVKTLLQNIESHFTENGDVYTTNPLYSTDTAAVYSDTELGLTVREFIPYVAQLLARSDRDISMVNTAEGDEPVYLLREMVDALHGIGFDPDTLSVEDSITMMMQHDLLGRDRTVEGSGAFPASMLESMVFLTGATTHFGFADGGASGETSNATNPITQHGHGAYTEAMTLNDSLISMTTYKTLNLLGLYDISLLNGDENYLSRSMVPFTTANRDSYKYDVNQNYAILGAMPGTCAGDFGTPGGGNPDGEVIPKNQYKPFNPTGIGETQLAAWTVNWAVRSCFGGEGPYYYADPDADTVTIGGRAYTKYLRPDGRVYALINKDNPTSWEYLYPTDERDAEDSDTAVLNDYNGLRQRFNRYKSTWHSDYYMYRRNNFIRTVDNSSGNLSTVALNDGDAARRLTYHELIPEDDPKRACASPEEAFFRNYQWVYTEKKMVLIIPQSLTLNILGMGLGYGSVYMILEAHGWSGLANMRIYEDNHVWAKTGNSGLSDVPGDFRVELVANLVWPASWAVSTASIYDTTLGRGHSNPAIVGKNLPALYRLAFPLNNGAGGIELGSREFEVGDDAWQNRNAMAPLFISLLQAIDKHRVVWPHYDRNSLKNGIVSMTNNLAPLLKPLIYYSDTADGTNPKRCWKMRVQTAPNGQAWYGEPYLRPSIGFGGTVRWDGTDDEWLHYQPRQMKTLLNVLIDSDMTAPVADGKRMDGVLPVLTQTRTMTHLFKVLMSEANDSNDLYSALEQILGAVRFTEGRMIDINRHDNPTKPVPFPDWMFAVGTGADDHGFYTGFSNVRDEDIVLDVGLDRLIGFEGAEGYGLVNYVDEQALENWADYHDTMDLLEDLLHPSSDYSLVESFIAMQDAMFARETRYSDEQVKGLVYTLGKLFTRYDTGEGRWLVQGEPGFADLYNIFKVRLPAIHDLVKDDTGENYHAALTVNADMLAETGACGSNGMIPYLLDAMSTEDGAEDILGDLHTFLSDDIVSEPRPLWSTLANLLQDMATAVDASKDGRLIEEVFKDYGFQNNGPY